MVAHAHTQLPVVRPPQKKIFFCNVRANYIPNLVKITITDVTILSTDAGWTPDIGHQTQLHDFYARQQELL